MMKIWKQALMIGFASALALGAATVSFAQDGPGAGSPPVPPGHTATGPRSIHHRHFMRNPNANVPPSYKNNGNENGPAKN